MLRFNSIPIAILLMLVNTPWALTNGPTQPEYGTYSAQPMGDLVDKYSGDFSYSIPLLDVPGIGGSYPLAMTYGSGITLDEEASWVGLGWNLNTGAISRSLNKYPDDYDGGTLRGEMKSNTISYTGWSWSVDLGFAKASGTSGRRSDVGDMRSVNYKVIGSETVTETWNEKDGWGMQMTERSALQWFKEVGGFFLSASGVIPPQAQAVYDKAKMGLKIADVLISGMRDHQKWTSGGLGMMTGATFGFNSQSSGKMHTNKSNFSLNLGAFSIGKESSNTFLYAKDDMKLYGNYYLSNFPRGDKWFNIDHSDADNLVYSQARAKMEYAYAPITDRKDPGAAFILDFRKIFDNMIPNYAIAVSTRDGYSASASGLGMGFTDFRQDIVDFFSQESFDVPGSLKLDFMDSPINYLMWKLDQLKDDIFGTDDDEDYANKLRVLKNSFDDYAQYGVRSCDQVSASEGETMGKSNGCWESSSHSAALYPSQFSENMPNVLFRQNSGGGAFKGQEWPVIAEGPSVANWKYLARIRNPWLTSGPKFPVIQNSEGQEMPDRVSFSTGIYPKFKKDSDPNSDPRLPNNALVGFTVVKSDGSMYEFNLPAINYVTKQMSATRPNDQQGLHYGGYRFSDLASWEAMERAYAYSWLITGMKSSDYVDLDGNGIPSDGDIGNWYKFSYTTVPYFNWRSPYQGVRAGGQGLDIDFTTKSRSAIVVSDYGEVQMGVKDIHYLTAIESPTHIAKLTLSDRDDGLEASVEGRGSSSYEGGLVIDGQASVSSRFSEFEFITYNESEVVFYSPYMALNASLVAGDSIRFAQMGYFNHIDSIVKKDSASNFVNARVTEVFDPCSPVVTAYCSQSLDRRSRNGNFNVLVYKAKALDNSFIITNEKFFDVKMAGVLKGRPVDKYKRLKKVDQISLFAKTSMNPGSERLQKVVRLNFENDKAKQLAPGVVNHKDMVGKNPGAKGGKLTLASVRYGVPTDANEIEWLPDYSFTYHMAGDSAKYDLNHWDRWGYYQPNGGDTVETNPTRLNHDTDPKSVHAWSIKSIRTPTGSTLGIEYESDSYSYIGRQKSLPIAYKEEIANQEGTWVNVGWEKGMSDYTSELKVKPIILAHQKFSGQGNIDQKKLRISSVFRIYKDAGSQIRMNKQFERIKSLGKKMHLYAIVLPEEYMLSAEGSYVLHDRGLPYSPFLLDLGETDRDFDLVSNPANSGDIKCQLNSVTFEMSLLKKTNWGPCNDPKRPGLCDDNGKNINIPDYLNKYGLAWGYMEPNADAPTFLQEFSIEYASLTEGYNSGTIEPEFDNDQWDIYAFQAHIQAPENALADLSSGRGLPGGGVRVKRISLNSGLSSQKSINNGKVLMASPNLDLVEYFYDCLGLGGGTFSSGAAGSIPPPFNNRGDDRPIPAPMNRILSGATTVGYRTVTERKVGRGHTIYDFLSPADVSDYVEEVQCSYSQDCYGEGDLNLEFYQNKRYRINRLNHLQGMLWRTRKYDEGASGAMANPKLVGMEKKTIGVMLNRYEVNQITQVSIMNGSDATFASEALMPMIPAYDGSDDANIANGKLKPVHALWNNASKLEQHPNFNDLGIITQRYRLRWMCLPNIRELRREGSMGIGNSIGVIDIEERAIPGFVISVDNLENGVGIRTDYSGFDFITGRPLVVTESQIGKEATADSKTTLSIPAYWVYDKLAPAYKNLAKFKDWAVGNRAQGDLVDKFPVSNGQSIRAEAFANRLDEDYSVSIYRNLGSYDNLETWWPKLNDPSYLMAQKFLPMADYTNNGVSVLRNAKIIELVANLVKQSSPSSTYHVGVKLDMPSTDIKKPIALFNPSGKYVQTGSTGAYDAYGQVLESMDGSGQSVAIKYGSGNFMMNRIEASFSGCVNKECDALTFEFMPSSEWIATLATRVTGSPEARSGTAYESLPISASLVKNVLPVRTGNHTLSVWFRPSAGNTTAKIHLEAGNTASKDCEYTVVKGIWNRCDVVYPAKTSVAMALKVSVPSSAANAAWVDDIRNSPIDAQVNTYTYDDYGKLSSLSDNNDAIKFFEYTNLGELIEIRDQFGMVYSTQAQHEAK